MQRKDTAMSKLLFEEAPEKNEWYLNHYLNPRKRILFVTACIFSLVTTMASIVGFVDMYAEGVLLGCVILAVMMLIFNFCVWWVWIKITALGKVGLHIYDDKIRYKKVFQKEYTEISLSPLQYQIRLHDVLPRKGYSVCFEFLDLEGNRFLTYNAVSMFPSPYQEPRQQWEIDIFAIGCEIIDNGDVIKNK